MIVDTVTFTELALGVRLGAETPFSLLLFCFATLHREIRIVVFIAGY
jgi:hypothetical protein